MSTSKSFSNEASERYARALFELASENSEIDKIVRKKTNEQLNQFSNIYFNKVKKNIIINEL